MAMWPAPPQPRYSTAPPGWWTPPPPPPQQRGKPVLAMLVLIVLIGAISSAFIVPKLILDPPVGAVEQATVDINATLDTGDEVAGTGMLIESNGTVLTNNHVVADAADIRVQVDGHSAVYSASVTGVDVADDIAVLSLSHASGLPTIPVGDSTTVKIGARVAALGNALGRGGSPAVTNGSVVAINETISPTDDQGNNAETLSGVIQFDADIQPGDSGGPLVDASGKVIGMNTAGSAALNRFFNGSQGFAIPINTALSIARQIISREPSWRVANGKRGIIGVDVQDGTDGVEVVGVQPGGPADNAGIAEGAVIVAINGRRVTTVAGMTALMRPYGPGTTVAVTWRDDNGFQRTSRLTLASGPLD